MDADFFRDTLMAVVSASLLLLALTGANELLGMAGLGATLSTILSIVISILLLFSFSFLVITYVA